MQNAFFSNQNVRIMKKLILLALLVLFGLNSNAQIKLPPSGANQKSAVKQYMGAHAYVKIIYNSPDVTGPRGEDRKGQIWGGLVPYGLTNLNFGISTDENPSPWRAGANENTVIHFSHDVKLMGKHVDAGSYGLHFIPRADNDWTLILSKNHTAWGSYFYKPEEDALRVDVMAKESDYDEWLTYNFTDRQENSCTVSMNWENLEVSFGIELENPVDIYISHLREEMQSTPGFDWVSRNNAATYCLQNEVNLEEAYEWAKVTAVNSFMGNENIATLQTKAMLEMKLDMMDEAKLTLEKAANHPAAGIFQIHQLGRQLIAMQKEELAMNIFEMNMERHGDVWPVRVGMARGLSALGKYDEAIEHAKIAMERAPDQLNKDSLAAAIEKLKNSEDIN